MGKTGQSVGRWLTQQEIPWVGFDDQNPSFLRDVRQIFWNQVIQVIQSPGIPHLGPRMHPVRHEALRRSIPVLTDLDLFHQSRPPNRRVVGITGTNGKSTTAALIHHLFQNAGIPSVLGGNFGVPLLDLPDPGSSGVFVLELSSFQLDIAQPFPLDVAVWLNLTPDHLDRHLSFEGYAQAKEKILERAQTAVIGVDFPEGERLAQISQSRIHSIVRAGTSPLQKDLWIDEHSIHWNEQVIPWKNQRLKGRHNQQNLAAAAAVFLKIGGSACNLPGGIQSFPGLAHRQELVRTIDDVPFINDSKATNSDSVITALHAFSDRSIVWIAGGIPKEGGLRPVRPFLKSVSKVYIFGSHRKEMAEDLQNCLNLSVVESLEEAVQRSFQDARNTPESVVLFSPGGASFDEFQNFEHRGNVFKALVQNL